MAQDNVTILSTRPLEAALIRQAQAAGIRIEEKSFIETVPIRTTEVLQEVAQILLQRCTVVFTSMNAVEAVASDLQGHRPDWRIYCLGSATRQRVATRLGEGLIAGVASSAAELGRRIAQDGVDEELVFFCGNRRREELPALLREQGIEVTEIVVYETLDLPQRVETDYQGILFFSPSAVESFFSDNRVNAQTILFAIGNTTATAIRRFCDNPVVVSELPGKDQLVARMIAYFAPAAGNNKNTRGAQDPT
ncbi:MAG TPA: uroporphyrinogen-III synthase [Chitinophagaceae bacterium]|nr:uroporphyrinogen-III synthase [Chitinophagaceae bacterium]